MRVLVFTILLILLFSCSSNKFTIYSDMNGVLRSYSLKIPRDKIEKIQVLKCFRDKEYVFFMKDSSIVFFGNVPFQGIVLKKSSPYIKCWLADSMQLKSICKYKFSEGNYKLITNFVRGGNVGYLRVKDSMVKSYDSLIDHFKIDSIVKNKLYYKLFRVQRSLRCRDYIPASDNETDKFFKVKKHYYYY